MERYDVKITVQRRLSTADVFGQNLPKMTEWGRSRPVCPAFKEGDVYISKKGAYPQGFCSWAFADIQRDIMHLSFGGNFPSTEEGVAYSCCTDGLKPVIFKLERVK